MKKSAALQLIVEAFLAGVVEGPAVSSLPTSRARLDRLADWKRARRGHQWDNVWEAALTDRAFLKYRRIHGQTFSTVTTDINTLHFTTLPSRLAGTSFKTWSITLPGPIDDHWFDSSQELLIVKSHNLEK